MKYRHPSRHISVSLDNVILYLILGISGMLIVSLAYAYNAQAESRELREDHKKLKSRAEWMEEKLDYLRWRESTAKGHSVPAEDYPRKKD